MKKDQIFLEKLPQERIDKSKIIALMNNKGGCGKTSTSIALGMYLVRTGHNVLFWDNDPQSNLTQRLGLPDDKFMDRRINLLFRYADMTGFEVDQRKIASIVEYPYIYRLNDSVVRPGKVGILAGSHDAEIEANSADKRMGQKMFSLAEAKHKDIFKFFRSCIQFYTSYFDYIIMDTAPAIEGNILNKLAVRAADEIIIPVDGIEAALGLRTLLGWISSQTREYNGGKVPNATLAMVKYQSDVKKMGIDPGTRIRNSVFRALKTSFGDYVCDNGVKESQSLRSVVSGFKGSKTDYYALCKEITNKISTPRNNIFKQINSDLFKQLETQLMVLQAKMQEKTPQFKVPFYATAK